MIGEKIRANADFPVHDPQSVTYMFIGAVLALVYLLVLLFVV